MYVRRMSYICGMRYLGTTCIIVGAVALLEGLVYLSRLQFRRRRRFQRFQRLLDGGNSLLPTPTGYENLHLLGIRNNDGVQNLKLGPRIDYGSYGVVYHGRWKGAHVAVKVLTYDTHNSRIGANIAREAAVSAALSHPNIVHVYSVSTKKVAGLHKESLETTIVMEYCDHGTLLKQHQNIWELFNKDSAAAIRWILRTLVDIAGGLEYMHSMGLVHGDIKCNNILLQSTNTEARGCRAIIADMGCARLLSATREAILEGTNGNPSYAAPEFLKESSMSQVIVPLRDLCHSTMKSAWGYLYTCEASDVYSFAICAWHLLSLGDQFFNKDATEFYSEVVDNCGRPTFPEQSNAGLQKLVQSCWHQVPMKRPTMSNVLQRLHSLYDDCL